MTHAPEFAARLAGNANITRAALVYDFIPRQFPRWYLPTAADRLVYAKQLSWLTSFDLFFPISQAAAKPLEQDFAISNNCIHITGCPIPESFCKARSESKADRHLLVIGGGDNRKNVEVVVKAHARSLGMQSGKGVELLIGGNYPDDFVQRFRHIARTAGGRDELLRFAAHVDDQALYRMYLDAVAVVTPSLAEGFSLPIVESMAAGVPSIASDIPAHRELIDDVELLFEPDDDETLTNILARILEDPTWRKQVIAGQELIWPRFHADKVAARFWIPLQAQIGRVRAPAVSRRRRPSVAVLSPMPPDRSGVADYTAACCSGLGDLVDVHVFTQTKSPTAQAGVKTIRPLTAVPHLVQGFDRLVSVVGNSHFHKAIFDHLLDYGGACLAHDARMIGFYQALLGRQQTLETASKEMGRPVTDAEIDTWLGDEGKLETLFLSDIASAASPMIVHSPVTVELCKKHYGVRPAYLPFSIYRPWSDKDLSEAARQQSRARLGIGNGDILIATFGFVHATKAPAECIWALYSLRRWGIPAKLHFVGDLSVMPDGGRWLMALAERLGLSAHILLQDSYAPEQFYRDHLVGADLGIQLRTYGLGGLSGGLLDCAAAGLPTVANQSLIESVGVPASYTRQISDSLSPLLLAEALADLLDASASSDVRSERLHDRQVFGEERSFARYAERLCEVLELDVPRKPMAGSFAK